MLKGLLGFLLFIFLVFVLILMLTGRYILNKIRELRKAAEDAAEQQAFRYRTETGRQRQQYNTSQHQQSSQNNTRQRSDSQSTARQSHSESSRQTRTSTGETIIDNRHHEREERKIFDDDEGEYVEFTEEK